jgi:putative DNA topoisomerase
MTKSDKPLFTQHEHALDKAYQECPNCGSGLSIKHGKSGAFLGCDSYPTCQYTRAVIEQERVEDNVLPGSECPLCSNLLAVKQGRYGMFIGCTNYPECHHIEDNQTAEDIDVACPSCTTKKLSGKLKEKTSRFGKTFYSCDNYPKCKYVLNNEPVEQECPECHWPVLIKRTMASGEVISCPQKKCTYKTKVI